MWHLPDHAIWRDAHRCNGEAPLDHRDERCPGDPRQPSA